MSHSISSELFTMAERLEQENFLTRTSKRPSIPSTQNANCASGWKKSSGEAEKSGVQEVQGDSLQLEDVSCEALEENMRKRFQSQQYFVSKLLVFGWYKRGV